MDELHSNISSRGLEPLVDVPLHLDATYPVSFFFWQFDLVVPRVHTHVCTAAYQMMVHLSVSHRASQRLH
jgi:hypothetical protein